MDPATIMQIAAAIAEAAKAAQEKAEFSRWQNDVGKKLDAIYAKTEEIIRELKTFRVELEASLNDRFRSYFIAGVNSRTEQIALILSGVPDGGTLTEDQQTRLQFNVGELRNLLDQTLAYGYAAVPTALASHAVLMPSMAIAGFPAGEIAATKESLWKGVFERASDPTTTGNFTWAMFQAGLVSVENEVAFVNGMRMTTVGYYYDHPHNMQFHWDAYCIVTRYIGSVKNPKGPFATELAVGEIFKDRISTEPPPIRLEDLKYPLIPGTSLGKEGFPEAEALRQVGIQQYRNNAIVYAAELQKAGQLFDFIQGMKAQTMP